MTDNTQDLKNQQLLSAYLDGELGVADRALAETLIRDNPRYAQMVEQWRESGIELRSLPKPELDDGFADRVLNSIADLGPSEVNAGHVSAGLNQSPHGANSRLALLAMGTLCALLLLALFVFPAMRNKAHSAAPVAANHGDLKTEPKPKVDGSTEVTDEVPAQNTEPVEEAAVAVSQGPLVRVPRAMRIAGANVEGGAVPALELAQSTQNLNQILHVKIQAKDHEQFDIEQFLTNHSIKIVKAESDSAAVQALEAIYAVASVSQMQQAAEQLSEEFSANVTFVPVPVVPIEAGNATRLRSRSFSSHSDETEIAELNKWFGLSDADDDSQPIRFLILLSR